MVTQRNLVEAMAAKLALIPEVMALLAAENPIDAYIDSNPTRNEVDLAIRQMQSGQLLLIWKDTILQTGTMGKWLHTVDICVKPLEDQSYMDLIAAVVNGVPNPGDGMYWRNCPLLDGVYPTSVTRQAWETNTEAVNYGLIVTETLETGDYPNP